MIAEDRCKVCSKKLEYTHRSLMGFICHFKCPGCGERYLRGYRMDGDNLMEDTSDIPKKEKYINKPKITCMPFDCVIRALKLGRKCSRPSWNNAYIYIKNNSIVQDHLVNHEGLKDIYNHSYSATSEDMLATDWFIPED
jgi:hypothetical protein